MQIFRLLPKCGGLHTLCWQISVPTSAKNPETSHPSTALIRACYLGWDIVLLTTKGHRASKTPSNAFCSLGLWNSTCLPPVLSDAAGRPSKS